MNNEYRFFYNMKSEKPKFLNSQYYRLFKILLFYFCSTIIILFYINGLYDFIFLACFEIDAFWFTFIKKNKMLSIIICFLNAILFLYATTIFHLFANGLVYIAFLIFFQLICVSKDFNDEFIQIEKNITYCNAHLFLIFEILLFLFLIFVDYCLGAKFLVIDSISASLLVGVWLLRIEKYFTYYFLNVIALIFEFILWFKVYFEFNNFGAIIFILLQLYKLTFCISNFIISILEKRGKKTFNRIKTDKDVKDALFY